MGVDPYEQVPVAEAELQPGDCILLYTDGVTERFDTDRQTYGEERLLRQLEVQRKGSPEEVLAAIMQDVDNFSNGRPADDDQALLLGIVQ